MDNRLFLLWGLKDYVPPKGNINNFAFLNKKVTIKNNDSTVTILGVVKDDYLNVCITMIGIKPPSYFGTSGSRGMMPTTQECIKKKGSLKLNLCLISGFLSGVLENVKNWGEEEKKAAMACWIKENGRLPNVDEIISTFLIWFYSYISFVAASFWGWTDVEPFFRHGEDASFMFYYPYLLYSELMINKNIMRTRYGNWAQMAMGAGWHIYHPSREDNPLAEYVLRQSKVI